MSSGNAHEVKRSNLQTTTTNNFFKGAPLTLFKHLFFFVCVVCIVKNGQASAARMTERKKERERDLKNSHAFQSCRQRHHSLLKGYALMSTKMLFSGTSRHILGPAYARAVLLPVLGRVRFLK